MVTGATASAAGLTSTVVLCLVIAFVQTASLWWLYFGATAEQARILLRTSKDPGRLARDAYTYLHLPIIAGIIVAAVGDELLLAHPTGHAEPAYLWTVVGGPALYLAGNGLFKWPFNRVFPLSHLVGLGLLALTALVGAHAEPLPVAVATTAALVVVAAWETLALRRQKRGKAAQP